MPPSAPATWDTRTIGFRGVPDSATRLRRRNLRRTGLVEITSASSTHVVLIGKQFSIRIDVIAVPTPFHRRAEEPREVHPERQEIADRDLPIWLALHVERMLHGKAQHRTATE